MNFIAYLDFIYIHLNFLAFIFTILSEKPWAACMQQMTKPLMIRWEIKVQRRIPHCPSCWAIRLHWRRQVKAPILGLRKNPLFIIVERDFSYIILWGTMQPQMMLHACFGSTRKKFEQAKRPFSAPFHLSIVPPAVAWTLLKLSSASVFTFAKGVISHGKRG